MVNIFGTSDCKGGQGPPGPPGDGGIKDFISWFPDLTLEQIRRKVNSLTLLIEKIPPARDSDVEFSVGKKVSKWTQVFKLCLKLIPGFLPIPWRILHIIQHAIWIFK